MCPQRAERETTLAHDVDRSVRRGLEWLASHIDPNGTVSECDTASLYYKVPAALVLSGERHLAQRTLRWIAGHLLGPEGQLKVPSGQPDGRAYDRGWLVWGASLCGRYDLAVKLAADLRGFQNRATGGFWDSRRELSEGRGVHHAMTVGMAGWGLLSIGCVEEARNAADFLTQLIQRQTTPRERLELVVHVSAAGDQHVTASQNPSDYVNCLGTRQRPARIGPAQVLLVRLYQLLGQWQHLEAAREYTDIFLNGPDGIYDCVESHKFMWGLMELYQVSPDPRLLKAADRIAEYILSRQRPDGQWWGDAIGGGSSDQSLDLRLNTTCNALVGLALYLHLAP